MAEFRLRLRELREERELSQAEMAKKLGAINEHFNNEFDKMHKNDLAG